ncbi:MAG: SAM-dependent chlorinase/fluorinase [Acidobacteria bacterium]|nr:SAM-dependent chlorinase/fluorinase [Acidobacteriota bacterium]
MKILTLLTDFGSTDYYVGAVKGTVLRLVPPPYPTLVDLGHDVAPGDVDGGAFLLAAAVPSFPTGTVHLAVVDPGVGSARRILVAEKAGSYFVGPDNGLLEVALEGGRAVAVERQDLFLPSPGSTFHGRDRFAPVAAALLRGAPPEDLGPPVADPVRLERPAPQHLGRLLVGRVIHIDRYGNLVSDLPTAWLAGGPAIARIAGHEVRHLAACYADLPAGEPGLIPGSLGTLEVSLRGASLAEHWQIGRGEELRVELR